MTFTVAEGMSAHTDAALAQLVLERLLDNAWKFTSKKAAAHIEVGAGPRRGASVSSCATMALASTPLTPTGCSGPSSASTLPRSSAAWRRAGDVRRMVTRLGGRCWAEGEVGAGAVVWFTLAGAS